MKAFKSSSFIAFILVLAWLTPTGESRGIGNSGGAGVGESGIGSAGQAGKNSGEKSEGSTRTARKVAFGGLLDGIGTYASYRNWDNNYQAESVVTNGDNFRLLESTYLQRREGSGMSAWTLLMIILGAIGGGTLLWYCYAIGVPLWRDRQASRRRSYTLTSANVKGNGDDIPLHETPSTATPSP